MKIFIIYLEVIGDIIGAFVMGIILYLSITNDLPIWCAISTTLGLMYCVGNIIYNTAAMWYLK